MISSATGRAPHLAMGQEPVPPVNIPIPTKIDSKMGGNSPTPTWDPIGFDNHTHLFRFPTGASASGPDGAGAQIQPPHPAVFGVRDVEQLRGGVQRQTCREGLKEKIFRVALHQARRRAAM